MHVLKLKSMKLKCIFTFECCAYFTTHMTKAKVEPYQSWECHASNRTHKFDCLSIVDVAIANCELFSFWFIIIHYSRVKKKRSNYYLVGFINLLRKTIKQYILICLIIKEFNNFTLKTSNMHSHTHRDEYKMLPIAENWHGNYLLLHVSIWY